MKISWVIASVGVIITLAGWYLIPARWGYGILGFGIAFIVLGLLDKFNEPARRRSS